MKKLRIGSRTSHLAQIQVDEVISLLAGCGKKIEYQAVRMDTHGDKDRKTSLTKQPADNFFTNTLDQALRDGKIDVAVHSAKDLPKNFPKGLAIFALTRSLDETDAFIGHCHLSELADGSRIGTSSLLRQQEVLSRYPALKTMDIRGNIEDRIKQFKDGCFEGIIVAVCALKRLGLHNEITEILPWDGLPLQGQLAIVGRAEDSELKKLFSVIDVRRQYGKVVLIGAGPGDPELVTVKAVRALQKADCIFYDYLVHTDLLDYALKAQKVYVGKRKGSHSLPQSELSRQLRDCAMGGKSVVRLKGGDPFIFGRGADEMDYLRSYHIPVSVIPGISSATGIPSSLGIPLTARGISSCVSFISGHGEGEKEGKESPINIPETDTIVFLMGLTKLAKIVKALLIKGWPKDTPFIVISQGTRVTEQIVSGSLENIETRVAQQQLPPPALMIAGEVVKFWQTPAHLQEPILYLGTNPEKYTPLGKIIHHPMIALSEIKVEDKDREHLRQNLNSFDMIILTSRYAVRYFLEFFSSLNLDLQILQDIDIVVIGEDTAFALEHYHLYPKLIATEATSTGLLSSLKATYSLSGKNILFPHSSLTNEYLKDELQREGARVTNLVIYNNCKPDKRKLPDAPVKKILFTSPSTVKNFLKDYGAIPESWQILAKGPRTQLTLKKAGYEAEIVVLN